jgi:hypothetical protein
MDDPLVRFDQANSIWQKQIRTEPLLLRLSIVVKAENGGVFSAITHAVCEDIAYGCNKCCRYTSPRQGL